METSGVTPVSADGRGLTPLNSKIEYLEFARGEETAVRAVVDSGVWSFRRPKNPSSRYESRCYALHNVCTIFLFLPTPTHH